MKTIFCALLFLSCNCIAQSIKRQSVSSLGKSTNNNGITLLQTVGQPYQTHTSKSNNTVLKPGFQQSVFKTELINTTIDVTVFPNPSEVIFTIESSKELTNVTLTVVDAIGKLIFSQNFLRFKKQNINCFDWTNGTYIVTITTKIGNTISTKVVKYL